MKIYWDTSAAINALVSEKVFRRLNQGAHFARTHLLSEFFSTMTGRGIRVRDSSGQSAQLILRPDDAVEWLRLFAGKVTFTEVSVEAILDGLAKAGEKSVSGGKVHDYIHALAAENAKAKALLTRNTRDFSQLTEVPLEWP